MEVNELTSRFSPLATLAQDKRSQVHQVGRLMLIQNVAAVALGLCHLLSLWGCVGTCLSVINSNTILGIVSLF